MIKTKSGKVLPINSKKKPPKDPRARRFVESGEGLIIYKHRKK